MDRTAEEFLHETRGMFGGLAGGLAGCWFIGDQVDMTRGDGYRFMLTDGRVMTEREIETAPRHRAPRLYRQKRNAKRAAQAWLERAVDEIDADKALTGTWNKAEAVAALVDVVRLVFPPPGARPLPSILLLEAIRKRLIDFTPKS